MTTKEALAVIEKQYPEVMRFLTSKRQSLLKNRMRNDDIGRRLEALAKGRIRGSLETLRMIGVFPRSTTMSVYLYFIRDDEVYK